MRRQIGLRTDSADAAGSLHGKIKDVSESVYSGVMFKQVSPSDNIFISKDNEVKINAKENDAYEEKVVYKMRIQVVGLYRISFDMKNMHSDHTHIGQLYVNGEAVGKQHKNPQHQVYVTYTEDLFLNPGDMLELLSYNDGYTWGFIKNFRLKGSFRIPDPLMFI